MWIISIGIGKSINGKTFLIVSQSTIKNTYSYSAAAGFLNCCRKAQPALDLRRQFR